MFQSLVASLIGLFACAPELILQCIEPSFTAWKATRDRRYFGSVVAEACCGGAGARV